MSLISQVTVAPLASVVIERFQLAGNDFDTTSSARFNQVLVSELVVIGSYSYCYPCMLSIGTFDAIITWIITDRQRSCGKVIFSQVPLSQGVGWGVCLWCEVPSWSLVPCPFRGWVGIPCPPGYPNPPTPEPQKRVVRILLECFLVCLYLADFGLATPEKLLNHSIIIAMNKCQA